ncbi:uncharacterized protein METZ01_LOCUS249702, partial [marine metagenome]
RIGVDCSERERKAEEAERRYIDWKKVQFMADKLGDSFEAFVTGVHAYGFFVELDCFFVEGLVHISSLDDDYYKFDEQRHTLKGVNNSRVITLGNRVKVKFVKVDKGRRRLDFALEEGPLETGIKPFKSAKGEQDRSKGPQRRRRRRRPRKTEAGGVLEGATTPKGAEQTVDKGGGQEARTSGPRRRRGSRRARGSGDGSRKGKTNAKEKIDGPTKNDKERRTRRSNAKEDAGEPKRRQSSRSSQRKQTARKTSSRTADSKRKRSMSNRKKTNKTTTKKVEGPKEETQRPKVNPYLTDL